MNFAVNENSWTLKFDNLSHLQNVISNNPLPPSPVSIIMTHCVRKAICDSSLKFIYFHLKEFWKILRFILTQFKLRFMEHWNNCIGERFRWNLLRWKLLWKNYLYFTAAAKQMWLFKKGLSIKWLCLKCSQSAVTPKKICYITASFVLQLWSTRKIQCDRLSSFCKFHHVLL